ncbi:MAG: lactate racemase domain-containing protein [Desulfatiglandales bacterium]
MAFPKMVKIRQEFKTTPIRDIPRTVRSELARLRLQETIAPGSSVAITAGSRGVANMATVLSTVVNELKKIGARPFIVPAMGSHGGATSEGQKMVLKKYGITEETMGVPIKSSMEVVEIGSTPDGLPVFLDKHASRADHIGVVNRVKPHTDFKAPIESGLMKMMTIGLGKQKGADLYHRGVVQYNYYQIVVSVAREVIKRSPIAFGLALVENQRDETALIRAVPPREIEETDRKLLRTAKRLMPRIPFDQIDILIVDQIGKEISGAGMDPNVIGRHVVPFAKVPPKPKILRIFVRDLSADSYGNAIGIGMADFTTKRLVEKMDRNPTYMNCITGCTPEAARIPVYFDSDREVLDAALRSLGLVEPENARIVHIADTLRLEEMEISEAMVAEAEEMTDLRVIAKPHPMTFDGNGGLISDLLAK